MNKNGCFDSNLLEFNTLQEDVFMANVSESVYNGQQMLVIQSRPDDQYPLKFGIRKARLILDHIEDIRTFVRKHSGGMAA